VNGPQRRRADFAISPGPMNRGTGEPGQDRGNLRPRGRTARLACGIVIEAQAPHRTPNRKLTGTENDGGSASCDAQRNVVAHLIALAPGRMAKEKADRCCAALAIRRVASAQPPQAISASLSSPSVTIAKARGRSVMLLRSSAISLTGANSGEPAQRAGGPFRERARGQPRSN
jgi:hypothetical protein